MAGLLLPCSLFATVNGVAVPPPVSGRKITVDQITPADVLARIKLIQEEVELIRINLKKPQYKEQEIVVFDAVPREVFYQAFTLCQKADRLCFETTGRRMKMPEIIRADRIKPFHVWHIINASYQRILILKNKLNIREEAKEQLQDQFAQPSDVFVEVMNINGQLNVLLEKKISFSDVFAQITVAINYASLLLAEFPGIIRIPKSSQYEYGKRAEDVYEQLQKIYEVIRQIAGRSGLKIIDLNLVNEEVIASDVYDISSLLISELAYVYSFLETDQSPIERYYPGEKNSSDVYQRVGILYFQAIKLKELVIQKPGWLEI